jgi:N-acetyl sugar amidotransferase
MIRHCRTCLMPSSRPRVVFDATGQCNACTWAFDRKPNIDWKARHEDLRALGREHQNHPGAWNCVVPFSGGKDSAAVAWKLRDAGFRPLLVCYGQLLWTDVGRRNLHRVADAGFDIVYWRTNQVVSRALARRFFIERGHPKQHYDAAVNATPIRTADAFCIPLVFYAEHGETEYGGHILSEENRKTRDLAEILENQVGDDPRNWATEGIAEHDLAPYIVPETWNAKILYFSHFERWDIYKNAQFAKEKYDFEHVHAVYGDRDRSIGSFEGFDSIDDYIDDLDYYMMYIKFGFGRATRMASRLIQNGHMTRKAGLDLVLRYDGEFPDLLMPKILDYLGMERDEFDRVVDTHRNPEIWTKEGEKWTLRHPCK